MTSRRDFIAKTLLLTNGAVFSGLPNQSAFSVATQKPKKAICIGAGFAGLSAAYRLKQNG